MATPQLPHSLIQRCVLPSGCVFLYFAYVCFVFVCERLYLSVSPVSGRGSGGFNVTISGSNLAANSADIQVTLAGVAVTGTTVVLSPTRIVVTAGATVAAVSGPVVINSTLYGSAAGQTFTYIPVRSHRRFFVVLLILFVNCC